MKISVAQTKPIKGDIEKNIENHKKFLDQALSLGADMIIFPELSITGYEPQLANGLATDGGDSRFDDFQRISNTRQITIGVGVPVRNNGGINIGMVLFQPQKGREIYSKQYLHADEEPFFVGEQSCTGLIGNKKNIALAICYELSVPQHAEDAFKNGAKIYIASAVKTISGVAKSITRLSEIANKYSMTVLLSNCVGIADGEVCGGKSSIWSNTGTLIGQLDDINEGILMIDTETNEVTEHLV